MRPLRHLPLLLVVAYGPEFSLSVLLVMIARSFGLGMLSHLEEAPSERTTMEPLVRSELSAPRLTNEPAHLFSNPDINLAFTRRRSSKPPPNLKRTALEHNEFLSLSLVLQTQNLIQFTPNEVQRLSLP